MTIDWKKVLKDAVKIRQKFVDCLDDEMVPEAIIASALSVVYETTYIHEHDFTIDFSTYSALGLGSVPHRAF